MSGPDATSPVGERIGIGRQADVLARGALATKLYQPGTPKEAVFGEAAKIAIAEGLGLPVPTLVSIGLEDGRWALTMSRAPGPTFADAVAAAPETRDTMLAAMVAVHIDIHSKPGLRLPSLKARLRARIADAALSDAQRGGLIARLDALPDGDRVCHGDFHPFNIMGPADRPVVIDWMDATMGPPAADLCRSWLLLHPHVPEIAEAYVAAYARASGLPMTEVTAWRPVLAAARLAENIVEEEAALRALLEAQ